jgi:hypothetical protein
MPRLALKSSYYSSCLSAATAKSEKDFFTIVFSACAIRHTGRASSTALMGDDFQLRGICFSDFFSSLLNFSQIPE